LHSTISLAIQVGISDFLVTSPANIAASGDGAKTAPLLTSPFGTNRHIEDNSMTPKKFYDWQTAGGTDDVMRMVDCLERADLAWCAIGGIAVNHWADEPMVTQDVDFVVAAESVELATKYLEEAGFKSERFQWSINFRSHSKVSIQLSTEDFYKDFPSRSVPADIHGILMRVASLEDTLRGKIKAWRDAERRQSKKLKDLGDIARLVESHPHLWQLLDEDLKEIIHKE
jgi:Nucleotidyl transferase AbiEii toxin, Type IV TA system